MGRNASRETLALDAVMLAGHDVRWKVRDDFESFFSWLRSENFRQVSSSLWMERTIFFCLHHLLRIDKQLLVDLGVI